MCCWAPRGRRAGNAEILDQTDNACTWPSPEPRVLPGLGRKRRPVLTRAGFLLLLSNPSQRGDFTALGSKLQLSKYFFCYCCSWAVQTHPWSIRQVRRGEGRVFWAPNTHLRAAGKEHGGVALIARCMYFCVGRGPPILKGDGPDAVLAAPTLTLQAPHPCQAPGSARTRCRSGGACFCQADKGSQGARRSSQSSPGV